MLTQIQTGDYKIIKPLGKGNFGTTYHAQKCDQFGGDYAIKKFTFSSQNQSELDKAKELFLREVTTLQHLNGSSHIPKFYGYYEENQEFYLVQELIDGKTLTDELQSGKFTEEKIINFLQKILEILDYIHSKDIIHRDIKPDNIMIRNTGELVLIDFGGVKIVKSTNLPNPGTQIFTPGYAPSEQRMGDPQFNSDIYAVGITAIQCLTNQLLTNQKEINENLQQLKISNWLQKILIKMIDDDYEKRYQSGQEILKDMQLNSEEETKLTTSVNESDRLHNILEFFIIIMFASLVILIPILFLKVSGVLDKSLPQPEKKQSLLINQSFTLL